MKKYAFKCQLYILNKTDMQYFTYIMQTSNYLYPFTFKLSTQILS